MSCQAKQSGRLRLARNEPLQGHEHGVGVVCKGVQRWHGLSYEERIGSRASPSYVTKTLDRVHMIDVISTSGRDDRRPRLPPGTAQGGRKAATVSPVETLNGDPDLDPINGEARPFSDWMTTFPLLLGVIDPYTHQSSWVLDSVKRIFHHYSGAGVRVAWLAAGPADGVKTFLGPYAEEHLTFTDPSRTAVKALGLSTLPALVLVKQDGTISAASEGWDPTGWRNVIDSLAALVGWSELTLPGPKDPAPYPGTPV